MSNSTATPLSGVVGAQDALGRLLTHVTRQKNGCWIWTRATDRDGYGRTRLAGQSTGAHRAVYLLSIGEIPSKHHLHHRCETKPCVNPQHLEPLTPADHNRLRAESRTHCRHGHAFDEANTYHRPEGGRACRKCTAGYQRAYQARKRAA